jgi:hypothetical protein
MAKTALTNRKDETQARKLVSLMLRYGDVNKAARELKLSANDVKTSFQSPQYLRILREEVNQVMVTDLIPSAISRIRSMLSGKEKPDKTVADLCKSILDRTGFAATKPIDQQTSDVSLEDMTLDQLQAFIAEKESAASMAAKQVDAPSAPANEVQAFDWLE